jgi:hypothetical protein
MLQMLALKINKHTYPIAAALLPGDFLLVPEDQTYDCVVVLNKPVGHAPEPISTKTHKLRMNTMYGRGRRLPDRVIGFENVWYDEETFNAEFEVNTTSNGAPGFWEVTPKPQPPIVFHEGCHCGGDCDYCHLNN